MPARQMSISDLRRKLKASEAELNRLKKQRSKVAAQLNSIDARIAKLEGASSPRATAKGGSRPAGRRHKGKPLVEFIQEALAGSKKGLRVKEITEAVQEAGYKSASGDFYGIVASTVRDDSKFKRVSRGVYVNK